MGDVGSQRGTDLYLSNAIKDVSTGGKSATDCATSKTIVDNHNGWRSLPLEARPVARGLTLVKSKLLGLTVTAQKSAKVVLTARLQTPLDKR